LWQLFLGHAKWKEKRCLLVGIGRHLRIVQQLNGLIPVGFAHGDFPDVVMDSKMQIVRAWGHQGWTAARSVLHTLWYRQKLPSTTTHLMNEIWWINIWRKFRITSVGNSWYYNITPVHQVQKFTITSLSKGDVEYAPPLFQGAFIDIGADLLALLAWRRSEVMLGIGSSLHPRKVVWNGGELFKTDIRAGFPAQSTAERGVCCSRKASQGACFASLTAGTPRLWRSYLTSWGEAKEGFGFCFHSRTFCCGSFFERYKTEIALRNNKSSNFNASKGELIIFFFRRRQWCATMKKHIILAVALFGLLALATLAQGKFITQRNIELLKI
jgi:hypothetical protein